MDRVQATGRYIEARCRTQLLDGQFRAAREYVGQAVTVRRVAVTVGRCGQGHYITGQADITTTAQGACIGVRYVELSTCHQEVGADVVRCQQAEHIATRGRAGHYHAQVQIAREHEAVDRVQATLSNRKTRSCAQLLDHQVGAGGQHVGQAVTCRHIRISVRRSGQDIRPGAANGSTTAKRSGVRICHLYGTTFDIQRSADATATLPQKRIHLETGGNTRLNYGEVQRSRVIHQRVDRVRARPGDFKSWHDTHLLDDEPCPFSQDIDRLKASRENGIPIGRGHQFRALTVKTEKWLQNSERSGLCFARFRNDNRIVLYFTQPVVRTCTLVTESAHVHTHALTP